MADDGLIEIVLGKDWCDFPAHAVVRVDPIRAAWLHENGYVDTPQLDVPATPPRRRKN